MRIFLIRVWGGQNEYKRIGFLYAYGAAPYAYMHAIRYPTVHYLEEKRNCCLFNKQYTIRDAFV